MAYKPRNYPTASPYLLVADAEACLRFLDAVFDAEPLRAIRDGDGAIRHAEARVEDSVVMIGQMPGGPGAHVHVYVRDVDAVYARALEAGATAVQAPQRKDDADRRGGVTDANGTTWWIATQQQAES